MRALLKLPLPLLVGCCLSLAHGEASALGMGGMRTHSALNQPFYAEIDLFDVKTDELDTVKVRLASREDFNEAGAERPHFLTRLIFTPMIGRNGDPVVQVTSREPIREPYLDLLVEVLWPQGRLVKEYTVLMDLPGSGTRTAPPVTQPRVTAPTRRAPPEPVRRTDQVRPPRPPAPSRAAPPPEPRQQAAPADRSTPAPVRAPSPAGQTAGSFPLRYGPVTSGSGLWKIARKMAPPGATVAQTAMALYRNNQDAFVGGNINLLAVGAELIIPTAAELFALDADGAERQFQSALAGRSVTSTPITDIPEQPELRIAVAETDDGENPTVDESGADPGAPSEKSGRFEEDLLLVRETSESNRQETTELRDRIRELEDQLGDIQRLLQLRNEQLAQLQLTGQSVAEDAWSDARQVGSDPAESLSVLAPAIDESERELLPKPVLVTGDGDTEDLGDRIEVPAGSPETTSAPAIDSEQDLAAQRPENSTGETSAMDSPDKAADPQSARSGLFGFLSPLTALVSPWALTSGLGAIVIGGLGLFAYRRRRSLAEIEPASPSLDLDLDSTQEEGHVPYARDGAVAVLDRPAQSHANAEAEPKSDSDDALVRSLEDAFEDGETLSIDLDSVTESELDVGPSLPAVEAGPPAAGRTRRPLGTGSNGERTPSSLNPVTQETDLVAEADIYILYGRYREAESILLDALAHSPKRTELRYKLAEAYIGGENRDALAALMEQMESAGEDRNDPARWFAMRQELGRMRPASGVAARSAGAGSAAEAGTATAAQALGPESEPDSEEQAQDATLEIDVDGIDPLGSLGLGDDEIVGTGLSTNEADLVPADHPLDQEDDLVLDLRDLDMLGELRADTQDTADALRAEATIAPALELPPDTPESSAAPRDDGAPIEFSDDLDLDLGALDNLASLDGVDALRDETLPDLYPLEDHGRRFGAEAQADDRLRLEVPFEAEAEPGLGLPRDPAEPAPNRKQSQNQNDNGVTDGGQVSADIPAGSASVSAWESESGIWDEVATKMDLARAYIEMEDPDAARAILKEVLGEGDEAQQGEAKALLATLG